MLRSVRLACWASAAVAAAATVGCNSDGFVPPPPPELNVATASSTIAPGVKVIELILAASDHYEESMWVELARSEVGEKKASFRYSGLGSGDPPARQAELIRDAVKRGATGLIVEPADSAEVTGALDDARDKGVAVVLIDRPARSVGKNKPIPLVRYGAPVESAQRLVDAAVQETRAAGLLERASAAILSDSHGDARTADRVEAFRSALKAAGIASARVLTFDAKADFAQKALHAARESEPTIRLVFATDEPGIVGAVNERFDVNDPKAYSIAGYMALVTEPNAYYPVKCAAVVDRKTQLLVRKAVTAVVDQFEGRQPPDLIEIEQPLRSSTAK